VNAKDILRQWTQGVNDLLTATHGHQCKSLAAMSLAMVLSGRCDSGRLSVAVPLAARPASIRRRLERLLANTRLHPAKVAGQMARSMLAGWSDRPLLLILDETPGANDLRCMKLSVGYRGRAMPLAWECYAMDHPPLPMPQLIWRLLRRGSRCLPAGAQVTLLADRGLSWPSVLDCCVELKWHYVLRLQSGTRVRDGDGNERMVREQVPRPETQWFAQDVQIFKKAGWRRANVVAVWERRCKEPWLLVTDLHGSYARCRGYCKRMWCEELHRDEKSQGFHWRQSQATDPQHVGRLVLLMALATLLALSVGVWLLKRGLRSMLEATRARKLSLFQLGMRQLRAALVEDRPLPSVISLPPP
jgi:hypothetical protein